MRVHNRCGHKFGRFAAREAEHHPLIARTLPAGVFFEAFADDALIDVGRLFVDDVDDRHRFAVETVGGIGIADFFYRITRDPLNIGRGAGRDFAADEHHARRCKSFACDVTFRVTGEAGVEYGVGNTVANFIGMSFAYRFGRKEIAFIIHHGAPELFIYLLMKV